MKIFLIVVLTLCLLGSAVHAKLIVKVDDPKRTGRKAVLKLTMKNSSAESIRSARAQVFLLNDEGKVVAQAVRWVIGGTKEHPPLPPNATATYNFVIDSEKAFTKTRVNFVRLILDGDKSVDVKTEVEIEK